MCKKRQRWPSRKNIRAAFARQRISLRKRLLRAVPVLIGAFLLTFLLSRAGLFRQLETYTLDTQMRLQETPHDSDVAMVLINDDDYGKIFQGKSPLDPANLQKLINTIARGRPRVIGVDIDTAGPEFRALQHPPEWPPIVWARNAVFSNIEGRYYLFNVLGGESSAPPRDSSY